MICRVVTYWLPATGHPEGCSATPWFRFEGEWGYRTSGHPAGASDEACLRLAGRIVHTLVSLPSDLEVSFEIVGTWVYPAGDLTMPWFSIVSAT